jgi:hypothetical protein
VLVSLDVPVAFQLPEVRLRVGRREDSGLLVGHHVVPGRVNDEEWHVFIGELRGLLLRHYFPGDEIREEPPRQQDRRPQKPSEAYELLYFAFEKEREVSISSLLDDRCDTRAGGSAQGGRASHGPAVEHDVFCLVALLM